MRRKLVVEEEEERVPVVIECRWYALSVSAVPLW